jgi:EAL domain-containing protein (putative c-di-GMP-specific phosphodiesterase class I)
VLHELKALGTHISMDDFGTGNSSLNYLRTFPFDKIKIDRSFIRDITANNGAAAIVRAVTGLGRSLNLTITAEGVETPEQLAVLDSYACTEVQGFLFSRPVPVDEASALARNAVSLRRVEPEADLLSRFPWKNPQVRSTLDAGRMAVEVSGDGNVLHGETV